jgi:hypothetical protein
MTTTIDWFAERKIQGLHETLPDNGTDLDIKSDD